MIPDSLKTKFDTVVARYPVKRSAIVPLLLFGQDELGSVTDELVEEIARRVEVRPIEVVEDIGYYSMLRRRPIGKYNFQVCTNISCLLRGGEEILEHCKNKLGIGHKESTPDGVFSLEEVECLGACCGAPAMQVNYEFYENLTSERVDKLIDALQQGVRSQKSGVRS